MTEPTAIPPRVGKIHDQPQTRDAIHVAIVSVVAADRLAPGEHIGLVKPDDFRLVGRSVKPLGIVDPYLTGAVFPGENFWMFLYPNTITALSHVWSHPAFPDSNPAEDLPPEVARILKAQADQVNKASEYLKKFAEDLNLDQPRLMKIVDDFLNTGIQYGPNHDFASAGPPPEFWDYYQVYSGRFVSPEDRQEFFTCCGAGDEEEEY